MNETGNPGTPNPKKLYNIDNTTNKVGNVTHYVDLSVETNGRKREMWFLVSDIGEKMPSWDTLGWLLSNHNLAGLTI